MAPREPERKRLPETEEIIDGHPPPEKALELADAIEAATVEKIILHPNQACSGLSNREQQIRAMVGPC
jgi:hypothetical protein